MKYEIVDAQEERAIYVKTPKNKTLGEIFKDHLDDIEICQINDVFREDWQQHKPSKNDEIRIFCKTEEIGTIVSILLSLAFTALASLFAPTPNKPSSAKNQPALGVAGIQNTVAPGTPKFLVYGVRRVFGHIIGSQIALIDPPSKLNSDFGRRMTFSVLYFMGRGPIQDIKEVQINGTGIAEIADSEIGIYTRLGTDDQSVIPGYELIPQVYQVNLPMDARTKDEKSRDPRTITYTTKSSNINKVIFFFQFPQGLWANNTGILNGQSYSVRVQGKEHGISCTWTDLGLYSTPRKMVNSPFFWSVEVELPESARWDLQLGVESQDSFRATTAGFNLFNVEEIQYLTTTYPGSALLEVHGIASDQITSFESMQGSAIVCGRFVDVYTSGMYAKQFSRNRVWIIRDLLFNQDVGLGNRLSSSLWDNGAGVDAASFYEESVADLSGDDEQRDYCDVIINETKSGTDWIKTLLFEGSATIFPSGGKFKYVIDKDRTPNLLYSSPGNIIEGTLQYQRGSSEKPINRVRAEFPNAESDYKVVSAAYPYEISEPERPDTISLTSITRESEASRIMQQRYKALTLIKDKWTWKSAADIAISEPLDVEKLAYQVSGGLRGYAGFISNNASTSSSIYTGKNLYLASGYTYTIHVRHSNTVEERYISNTLGQTHSILYPTSYLSFTPATGDVWSLGKENNYIREIQFDEIDFDGEVYNVTVHGHVADVYDNTATRVTIPGATTASLFPRPLLSAQVNLGTTYSYFNVVPGFDPLVGVYSSAGTNSVVLSTAEPSLDDFFNDSYITIDSQILEILDYTASSYTITTNDPGFSGLGATGSYSISWLSASDFYGFFVEGGTSSDGIFSSTGITPSSVVGTSLTAIAVPASYTWFRFTPYDSYGNQNTTARWVIQAGITDSTAPIPPVSIDMSTNSDQYVTASMLFDAPLERDVQYVQVEFLSGSATGVAITNATTTLDISGYRDESILIGPRASVSVDLSSESFGTSIFGRASTIDFYGNISNDAISFVGVTLTTTDPTDYTETTLYESTTNEDFSG